jgi:hypothetical protein
VGAVRIERIAPGRHDRSVFDCGDPAVDGWLRLDAVAAGLSLPQFREGMHYEE